jgi:PqqD family protein of HPr-rel-A system
VTDETSNGRSAHGLAEHPAPNPAVTLERSGKEAVLYDRASRRVHVVNESAARLFELCDGETTIDEITDRFARSYAIEPAEVKDDVRSIVATLRGLGVLT